MRKAYAADVQTLAYLSPELIPMCPLNCSRISGATSGGADAFAIASHVAMKQEANIISGLSRNE